jgi:hypothetical protein
LIDKIFARFKNGNCNGFESSSCRKQFHDSYNKFMRKGHGFKINKFFRWNPSLNEKNAINNDIYIQNTHTQFLRKKNNSILSKRKKMKS